ncbi:hypothetical protein L9F63_026262, partial [Diploptera punctata]
GFAGYCLKIFIPHGYTEKWFQLFVRWSLLVQPSPLLNFHCLCLGAVLFPSSFQNCPHPNVSHGCFNTSRHRDTITDCHTVVVMIDFNYDSYKSNFLSCRNIPTLRFCEVSFLPTTSAISPCSLE